MEFIESSISLAVESQTKQSKRLSYGTAGFRDNHQKFPLNSVFVRMGILASFRSLSVASKPTGVMITASHNEECDNGIKIVDFDGGMLTQTWEPYAEQLANADTAEDFILILKSLSDAEGITSTSFSKAPIVLFGRDTRPHSLELAQCVKRGIESCGAIALDMGEVTTPQLHFFVERLNSKSYEEQVALSAEEAAKDYFKTLSAGYQLLNVLHPLSTTPILPTGTTIVIDASCGVGSYSVDGLMEVVNTDHQQATAGEPLLTVDVRNTARSGPVNDECGAELVQKGQRPPKNVDVASDLGKLMCSFDGDADRIVFHTYLAVGDTAASSNWLLFDGDKIAALVASLISQELRAASLDTQFALGVVQTAYANGGSTNFFRENGIPVDIAKTGVKFVHHKAKEFDIGVYFEANGHGTVLFSQRFLGVLEAWTPPELAEPALDRRDIAMHRLKILNLDAAKWHAFYSDLPSKMIKLGVRDKSSIRCSEDETRVVEPQALQAALDAAMAAVDRGRCFVRPSGTEDVVRVYAEASTSDGVEELIAAAVDAIQRIVGW